MAYSALYPQKWNAVILKPLKRTLILTLFTGNTQPFLRRFALLPEEATEI